MDEREQKIERLKDYFAKRDDIVMAFLFGSQAKGAPFVHSHSDWDIGVYFIPTTGRLEWEELGRSYPAEDDVARDVCDILASDTVDLLVMNRAPAGVVYSALRGLALAMKDRALWTALMLTVGREAEDYYEMAHEFFEVSERSRSLTSFDRHRLERILQFLGEQVSRYPYFQDPGQFSETEYRDDPRKRNDIERWVENSIYATIDVSKILLASRKVLIPETYRALVAGAARTLDLPGDFSDRFDGWVRLRNVLAHEYLDVKWQRLSAFAATSEPYICQFLDAAKRSLNQAPAAEEEPAVP